MIKRILMDVSVHQTRFAVVEDGILTELIYEENCGKSIVGNIYIGRISNVLLGMQAAFVDIGEDKNAYLYFGNIEKEKRPQIGQEILVQVEKDAAGQKGAVITTNISFPGRFVVLTPFVKDIGISKKITKEEERNRIKTVIQELLPTNCDYGIIVRTNGKEKAAEDYQKELNHLIKICDNILLTAKHLKAPALIYGGDTPYIKAFRELYNSDIDEFIVNHQKEYNLLVELCEDYHIDTSRVHFYKDKIPLFERYSVESQIDKAFLNKVWLKSGGFLVIEQTEALAVIDVNTGKYTGKKNLDATFFKTNKEAAIEAAKQIRLRNLSGIIIIDFIDMKEVQSNQALLKLLEEETAKDRIQTTVVGMTELGLVQLTRKKMRPPLWGQLTKPCHCCKGLGRVPDLSYILGKLRREVISIRTQTVFDKITISADKRLLNAFAGENEVYIKALMEEYGGTILMNPIATAQFGYYEIEREKEHQI